MPKELTKRQELFIAEYLIDMNAASAAISAGYSRKGAEQTGSVLLRNPKVFGLRFRSGAAGPVRPTTRRRRAGWGSPEH
jgi:hypothetical protein